MSVRAPASLKRFAALVSRADGEIDLARACLQIAEDVYPGLDVDGYLGEIERFAGRLRARLAPDAAVEDRVIALNEFLFGDLGFCGNADNYYDPRNSYLNEVLDRRAGIPLTLSVLYLEFGWRIDLPLAGVSFPGHFLVRLPMRGGTLVLDPFAGGVPQSGDELRERLKRVIPRVAGEWKDAARGWTDAARGVAVADLPLEQFLEPASRRQILARLLRNLKGIYREKDSPERLLQVLNRMIIVAPEAAGERRDRGYVYQRLECWRPALQDLSDYLEREPEAADQDEVRARVVELAGRCARLN
jgi:regulator of sirC expression with transglutaminase-like and TPR domain